MGLIQEILAKKNLDPQLFEGNFEITADMPIDLHVAWVYDNIYSSKGRTLRDRHLFFMVKKAMINNML